MAPRPKADAATANEELDTATFFSTLISSLKAGLLTLGLAVPILALRTEQDMFDCVAWLYDGFPLPQQKGRAA